MRLGFVLPSNNPKNMMRMVGSLDNMKSVLPDSVFLLNLQPPWTKLLADQLVQKFELSGAKAIYRITKKQTGITNFSLLRKEAIEINRFCEIYCFIDDDMIFEKGTKLFPKNSGTRYKQVLDYMGSFPSCGVVMCDSFLGGDSYGSRIAPSMDGLIATSRGLFLRNIGDIFPITPVGHLEETLATYNILRQGLYLAKQFNNPTTHNPDSVREDLLRKCITDWVRTQWGDIRWSHDRGLIPQGLLKEFRTKSQTPDAYFPYYVCCKRTTRPYKFHEEINCPHCNRKINLKAFWKGY